MPDAAPLEELIKESFQVVGYGNLSRRASLLVELKHPPLPGVKKMVSIKPCHRSDSGPRVGERLYDELIA
jgi:hypothetical protein